MEKKYFKVGQTVYNQKYGMGVVNHYTSEDSYPVKVRFASPHDSISFTDDGRQYKADPISLSQNPIPEIINEPIDDRIELPEDVVEFFKLGIMRNYNDYQADIANLKAKYKI